MGFWKGAVIIFVLFLENTVTSTTTNATTTNETLHQSSTDLTVSKNNHQSNTTEKMKLNTTTPKYNPELTSHLTENETDEFVLAPDTSSDLIYSSDTNESGVNIRTIFLKDHVYRPENSSEEYPHVKSAELLPGTLAAILAGIFVVISIVGYVMMLSWRRYLENRYGNRQMLVDESNSQKMNDLEHFSI